MTCQGDSAVVGRHTLVPARLESFPLQPPHRALGEITILETTARKHDAVLAAVFGNGDNGFDQRIVEFRGNLADGNAAFYIQSDCFNHRRPIQNKWRVTSDE